MSLSNFLTLQTLLTYLPQIVLLYYM